MPQGKQTIKRNTIPPSFIIQWDTPASSSINPFNFPSVSMYFFNAPNVFFSFVACLPFPHMVGKGVCLAIFGPLHLRREFRCPLYRVFGGLPIAQYFEVGNRLPKCLEHVQRVVGSM